jgi:hypothetical protein
LRTVDGRSITRATVRGQVTLLQFGAAAKDDALFWAELMYRALKNSGLSAFYVAPMQFDMGAYTVPVAVDPGFAAAEKFGMRTGVVLIDRLGKILYADISRNSQELVEALQQAGVWR